MATIILRGADFSANNIGKVEISRPFDALTISALERNGVTVDETDSFQKALNSFFISLRIAGLVGDANAKIKALCLPFLSAIAQAGNTAYAQLNVLNGSNFFTKDILGSLTLTDNGLKVVDGADVKSINLTDYTTYDDVHLAAYNMTDEPFTPDLGGTGHYNKFIFGSCSRIYGLNKNRGSAYGPHLYIPYILTGDANYSQVPCLMIGNLIPERAALFVNGQMTQLSNPAYANNSLSNPMFGVYIKASYTDAPGPNLGCVRASYSLLSVGKAMTDAQSVTYNDAVNNLMIAVNAYL